MAGARKRKRLDAAKHPSVEDRLQDGDNKSDPIGPKVPLKHGGQMEIGWARAWESSLRRLLEDRPDHFRSLHALVEGRGGEVSLEHRRDLKRWSYLLKDGTVHPGIQAIMTAAVRQTPDGLAIVDPVNLNNREDAAVLKQFGEQLERRARTAPKRLLRRLFPERDKDDGPSQSR